MTRSTSIERIERAIAAIARGEMIILVDDEGRENEGDIVMAAEKVTPEAINFMARHARGLICVCLTEQRLLDLQIPMMVQDNQTPFGTAFTVSVEARHGVTTGISAADRAHTIKVTVDPASTPYDLVRPGHIFPLRARPGGVLVRTGQTEGSVDLARLAGLTPGGVVCEIMNDDGTMARMPDLEEFARAHDMLIVSIADLIEYRMHRESLVEKLVDAPCPTEFGDDFRVAVFKSVVDNSQHVALYRGTITPDSPTLVRVQYHVVTADVFHGTTGKHRGQVHEALTTIGAAQGGVLLYMYPHEQTPYRSVVTHVLQQQPGEEAEAHTTRQGEDGSMIRARSVNQVNPEFRDFGVGAQILRALGVGKTILLTNNPKRIIGVEGYGLDIVGSRPIGTSTVG